MRATYGDLVGRAGVDIHTGLLHVMRRGFRDAAQAQNTIGVYYDLLGALRSHTYWLLEPTQTRAAAPSTPRRGRADRGDLDRVAASVFAGLGPLAQRPVWMPYPDPRFDHPWRDAAARIGAATDLLATHLGPRHEPRSEHAALVLDREQRHGALAFIAALTDVTLNADSAIGAACRHRDIPWQQVNHWLPDRSTTKALTHRMHELASRHDGHALRDVPSNIYPVREGDPVVELGDRVLRLRHAAWQLACGSPDYSVVTLHDLAGLGMATHLHTAHAHGTDFRAPGSSANRLVATARAFQRLMVDLEDYLAPGPPDPAVRVDILASRQLLTELAPVHRPVRTLTICDPRSRDTLEVLHGACDVLAQIARVNQTTFATLAHSGLVHIPTRLLDGETLSEDPAAAAAKLAGARRILAPTARVRETIQLYASIGALAGHVDSYAPPMQSSAVRPSGPLPACGVRRKALTCWYGTSGRALLRSRSYVLEPNTSAVGSGELAPARHVSQDTVGSGTAWHMSTTVSLSVGGLGLVARVAPVVLTGS